MHIPLFPTIPFYHQQHRQNTIHGFSCKRSQNTSRHCNRAMWYAAISVVANCMALTFNFLQRYCIFLTKQFGGKQLFNFHDCGCRGTTALQPDGTISSLGCRAVTPWQLKKQHARIWIYCFIVTLWIILLFPIFCHVIYCDNLSQVFVNRFIGL